jgi:hypothetical protein
MSIYYNEIDPFECAWLRELINANCIMDGYVDERSILDVKAGDLTGVHRAHWFAGSGGVHNEFYRFTSRKHGEING